jgi:tripeptidyl-peptidase-1
MFAAEFHNYASPSRLSQITRSHAYTIPAELEAHVQIVQGVSNFPMYRHNTQIASSPAAGPQPGGMYPALIFKTYRLPNETDPTPKANAGVFEALGQSYSDSDLAAFQKQYNLPRQKVAKIVGPNDGSSCSGNPDNCVEATLDVQYIMAMAQGAPLTYWSVPQDEPDIFVYFIEQVAADPTPPLVHSISYGGPESLQDASSMQTFNSELCKAGLRGLTIFVASGDDGVAGYQARDDPSQCGFNPDYPANCPFITCVGATMGPDMGSAEVVCQSDGGSIITSGGGFSNTFTRPAYQNDAVSTYLRTANIPPSSMFNTGGRAYPDVASLGNNYPVVIGGQTYQLSGTSASCPVFCAMVALVNGDREVRGKAPLGFLNPILYKVDKTVYNDITSGENNCAAGQGNPTCCQYGFYASKGWDATTGWGSLDFKLFADELSDLP